MTNFCPALGGSGLKSYKTPTMFYQKPSSGSGEEVENAKFTLDGQRQMNETRTDDAL